MHVLMRVCILTCGGLSIDVSAMYQKQLDNVYISTTGSRHEGCDVPLNAPVLHISVYLCKFIVSGRASQAQQALALFCVFVDAPALIQQLSHCVDIPISGGQSRGGVGRGGQKKYILVRLASVECVFCPHACEGGSGLVQCAAHRRCQPAQHLRICKRFTVRSGQFTDAFSIRAHGSQGQSHTANHSTAPATASRRASSRACVSGSTVRRSTPSVALESSSSEAVFSMGFSRSSWSRMKDSTWGGMQGDPGGGVNSLLAYVDRALHPKSTTLPEDMS
ncbi:hypothetical protein JZ751_007084 [Albula glossodonta]|uniref:Uncharacterized protein n=1 Tax=Albula glossodonta TaxID=121402 RepID=A0A8T2PDF1_9TELE|nr:hypothetical protein JZ751_007084 [Albula glossodonta]